MTVSSQPRAIAAGSRGLRWRLAALAAVPAALASCLVMGLPGSTASATTGDTYVLPPSQYIVPLPVMSSYYGTYRLTRIGAGARLHAADMFITENPYHDLYGGGSFFGYDATGTQDSWTNILYDFHLIPPPGAPPVTPWLTPAQASHDQLVVRLYGWGSPSLGTMWLTRSADGGLTGVIQLRGQPGRFAISFRKLSSHP